MKTPPPQTSPTAKHTVTVAYCENGQMRRYENVEIKPGENDVGWVHRTDYARLLNNYESLLSAALEVIAECHQGEARLEAAIEKLTAATSQRKVE